MLTETPLDHVTTGLSRVALQYQNSPKFLAFLETLLTPSNEVEKALLDVLTISSIDESVGVQLDVLGIIVGVNRFIENGIVLKYFGFSDQVSALGYGEEGIDSIGGRFREENENVFETNVLPDPEFRVLLKAKVAKNHSTGTCQSIINVMSYLFDGAPIIVDDTSPMAIGVGVGKALSYSEQVLLKNLGIVPKPAGVRMSSYFYFAGGVPFGFEDQANVAGLGEEGFTAVGGVFAEEF